MPLPHRPGLTDTKPADRCRQAIVRRRGSSLLLCLAVLFVFGGAAAAQESGVEPTDSVVESPGDPLRNALFQAARNGDLDAVRRAIESGVDVNATTAYGTTALFFACDRGYVDIVKFLLEKGADPNKVDTFYGATPMTWAASKKHLDVIAELARNGADGREALLLRAVATGDEDLVRALLAADFAGPRLLGRARDLVPSSDKEQIQQILEWLDQKIDAMNSDQLDGDSPIELPLERLDWWTGHYRMDGGGLQATIERDGDRLTLQLGAGAGRSNLSPLTDHEFTMGATVVRFPQTEGPAQQLVLFLNGQRMELKRVAESHSPDMANNSAGDRGDGDAGGEKDASPESAPDTEPRFAPDRAESLAADRAVSGPQWPGFRGTGARGVAEGQHPPLRWDWESGQNILWSSEIPGLGNSCPTIWGDHVYVTTAIGKTESGELRIGLYGDVDPVQDDDEYQFCVMCFDRRDGTLLWKQICYEGKPAVKRHPKSTHANPTVATDGHYVVAFFGSEGLFCLTPDGKPVWQRDFGILDSGWFYDPGYQWGFGASPVIFEGRVFLQSDIQEGSFVAALDLETGQTLWRTSREEIPTWSTPTVHRFGELPMLITHGTRAARGYDARDGRLLWTMPKHSEIVVPTPFVAHDLIFLASGYRPIQPIVALRNSARGELTPATEDIPDEGIAWKRPRGGPYMPTPIVYGDYLYCCSNNGILTCIQADTGREVYRERMRADGGSTSFTASPVAADGHLYLTAEDGRVLVVKAGPEYDLVAVNKLDGPVLATPAISRGSMFFRTSSRLVAVSEPDDANSASQQAPNPADDGNERDDQNDQSND